MFKLSIILLLIISGVYLVVDNSAPRLLEIHCNNRAENDTASSVLRSSLEEVRAEKQDIYDRCVEEEENTGAWELLYKYLNG